MFAGGPVDSLEGKGQQGWKNRRSTGVRVSIPNVPALTIMLFSSRAWRRLETSYAFTWQSFWDGACPPETSSEPVIAPAAGNNGSVLTAEFSPLTFPPQRTQIMHLWLLPTREVHLPVVLMLLALSSTALFLTVSTPLCRSEFHVKLTTGPHCLIQHDAPSGQWS